MISLLNKKYLSLYKVLSHPIRLTILKTLIGKDLGVVELSLITQKRQSNVSQHLQVLRENHIVNFKKQGKQRIYAINRVYRKLLRSLTKIDV